MLDRRLADVLGRFLIDRLRKELIDQGHNLTGSLISSLEYRVANSAKTFSLQVLANDYGEYLNTGVKPNRIPYRPGAPRGRSSKYIQALIRYVERRMGLRGKEATSVAFAIARKHAREGMPTASSYKYSANGRRTGWVDVVLKDNEPEINKIVDDWVGRELEALITQFVAQAA